MNDEEIKCNICNSELSQCDWCDHHFEKGELIICDRFTDKHFCDGDELKENWLADSDVSYAKVVKKK